MQLHASRAMSTPEFAARLSSVIIFFSPNEASAIGAAEITLFDPSEAIMFRYSSPSFLQANLNQNHAMNQATMKIGRDSLLILTLGYFAMLLLLCGWNTAQAGEHVPKSDLVTRPGAKIFHSFCSVCHGDKGDGQSRARNSFLVPPRDYTTTKAAKELNRERMIHSVTNGRPGTAMIPWKTELTAAEIEGVVDYIRATFMQLDSKVKLVMPSDKLLASRGGVLYMKACALCHGEMGKREMSGRMLPPPTNFTSQRAAYELNRKRMIDSISNGRPGTAMKGYADEFSKDDIAAMADFISEAFMPSANPKK